MTEFELSSEEGAELIRCCIKGVFRVSLEGFEPCAFARRMWAGSALFPCFENAELLEVVCRTMDELRAGKINHATGRWYILRKMQALGYESKDRDRREAERALDFSTERLLNLLIETNTSIEASRRKMIEGNGQYAQYAYPAWELIRLFDRRVDTDRSRDKYTESEQQRWRDAGKSVGWEGALESPFVAKKESPIWQALGNGAGGYTDVLGNPFPPFALGSGLRWRAVSRTECARLELLDTNATPEPMQAQMPPATNGVRAAFEKLSPEVQEQLRKELRELAGEDFDG